MTTAIEIAAPLVVCGWFFAAFIRGFCTSGTPEEEPASDPRAWIDDRIRTERHTAKRQAWRSIRDDDLEKL